MKRLFNNMKNHPGNSAYLIVYLSCSFTGLHNPNAPWWFGFVVGAIFLLPVYILTSWNR